MKIALIGYGKMGRTIEGIALERGHEIVCKIDKDNTDAFDSQAFASADVAIEFTTPGTAVENCERALRHGVAVVSGTTGWNDKESEVRLLCEKLGGAFMHSSNFSIGVNIFFAVNRYLAKLMNRFSRYNVSMREIHHIHKLDHPSGTAITLANDIIAGIDRKSGWAEHTDNPELIDIECERVGEVPGTHIIEYRSEEDAIRIEHEAFSRNGFALGAVVAAEWIKGRKGCFSMNDMLDFND